MTLYELIKEYGKGRGEESMWASVKTLSDYLDKHADELEDYDGVMRMVYADMCGSHYNLELAEDQIAEMFYTDKKGEKHYGPYWSKEKVHELYEGCKGCLPREVNEHDFAVTINMIKADYGCLLESWFDASSEDELTDRIVEMACAFLCDADCDDCETKIWDYFN